MVAAAVVVAGVVLLVHTAWPVGSQAATGRSVATTAATNRLDDCLADAARRLVPAGATVAVDAPDLAGAIALLTSVAPWARPVARADGAQWVLVLTPGTGPGSCSGYVVSRRPGGAP